MKHNSIINLQYLLICIHRTNISKSLHTNNFPYDYFQLIPDWILFIMLLLHAHTLSARTDASLSSSSTHLSGENSAEDAADEPLHVIFVESVLEYTNLLKGGTREHWLYRHLLALSYILYTLFSLLFTYLRIFIHFFIFRICLMPCLLGTSWLYVWQPGCAICAHAQRPAAAAPHNKWTPLQPHAQPSFWLGCVLFS